VYTILLDCGWLRKVASDSAMSVEQLRQVPCGKAKHDKMDDMSVIVAFLNRAASKKRPRVEDGSNHSAEAQKKRIANMANTRIER